LFHTEQKRFYFISNFRFGIIEVLKNGVAAVLTAECHAGLANLRIRRLKPPLHRVAKPKAAIAVILFFYCNVLIINGL
jgi:hypothetical protein